MVPGKAARIVSKMDRRRSRHARCYLRTHAPSFGSLAIPRHGCRKRPSARDALTLRRVLADAEDSAGPHGALVQEWSLDPVRALALSEPPDDQDAVAHLQKGVGEDPRTVPVLVAAEGGPQHGGRAREDSVEGEALYRGVDPLHARVEVAGRLPRVVLFERLVGCAHRRRILHEFARGGQPVPPRASDDHAARRSRAPARGTTAPGTGLESAPERMPAKVARPGPFAARAAIVPERATTARALVASLAISLPIISAPPLSVWLSVSRGRVRRGPGALSPSYLCVLEGAMLRLKRKTLPGSRRSLRATSRSQSSGGEAAFTPSSPAA